MNWQMVQIKNFTALQKLANFQISRRENWPWQDKILSSPELCQKNFCESTQSYFSYILDKPFHLPEFLEKL